MPEIPDWISNALWLGGGGLTAWLTLSLTGRRDRKSAENQLIDQLQEQMHTQAMRLDLIEKRNVLLWQYNHALVNHIWAGKPPPPPAMPDGLV
jgi:hypothetical protein